MSFFDNDDGLPDAAFTADELSAGVQHLARGHDQGYINETYQARESNDNEGFTFETFKIAMAWAKSNPGGVITRSPDGDGYIIKNK